MSGFTVSIPRSDGTRSDLHIAPGDLIFLIGPNGSGKSTLLHHFKSQLGNNARSIVAHRQNWFENDSSQITAANRKDHENSFLSQEAQPHSRTRDNASSTRNQVLFYDLIDLTSRLHQELYDAYKAGDRERAELVSKKPSPFDQISSILQSSSLPITISSKDGGLLASKDGCPAFGISNLSDGEKNALLIASYAITMPRNCVLLLDEPERHLHRSIAAPLISSVLEIRPDCAFVVSTHELALAIDNPSSRVLQIQSFTNQPTTWDFDELAPNTPIREDIADSILGMRRKILVVEGISSSLDLQIYRILFPSISVFCKASSSEVKNTIAGINDSQEHHRCKSIGIVDGDAMVEADRAALVERGIYPLDFYSVEYLYYCREVFEWVIRNHVMNHGVDPDEALRRYETAILTAMTGNRERMVSRVCEQTARKEAMSGLPTWEGIATRGIWAKSLDLNALFEVEAAKFDEALAARRSEYFLFRFPFRESNLPGQIANICGLTDRAKYENLVRSLASRSSALSALMRGKLGQVADALQQA